MKPLHFNFAILLAFVASSFTLPGTEKANLKTAAPAHVDYYLKIEGVDGESKDDKHKGWIELTSSSLSQERKTLDIVRTPTPIASRALQNLFLSQEHFKQAILHVRKADGSYMEIKMQDVFVSSWQTSASGDDRPTEEVTFVFGKVTTRP